MPDYNPLARKEVSTFYSNDGKMRSIVYANPMSGTFEVDFENEGAVIKTESYPAHNLNFHEDAAENYVLGIKKV